jgi:hypothetical protein
MYVSEGHQMRDVTCMCIRYCSLRMGRGLQLHHWLPHHLYLTSSGIRSCKHDASCSPGKLVVVQTTHRLDGLMEGIGRCGM